jgi:hypothetical protein
VAVSSSLDEAPWQVSAKSWREEAALRTKLATVLEEGLWAERQ